MTFWNPDNIRVACGGSWASRPAQIELPKDRPADLPLPDLHAPITGVSTDSRTIRKGQMFIALRGENFDGHRFVADAVVAGAPVVVVDDAAGVPAGDTLGGCGVLRVADTGKALLRIAGAYRESLKRTKVIAVCGSNGKTTTTRLIDHLLGRTLRGTASQKSFNNAVGVPLTILSAKESDQYLVCEVGTNHPGEIKLLAEVVRPDIAVITSIGREHLEGFGDLAGVAAEEATVLKHLRPGGWAVATADAPELVEHLRGVKNLVTFGRTKEATLRLTEARHEIAQGRAWLEFTVNGRQKHRMPLVGEHNALNAMAALAVARRLGVDDQKAADALTTAGAADMRLEIVKVGGTTVLNDAYNANPDSMIAAIDTLIALKTAGFGEGGRAVCVLGEMLEMGDASEAGHRAVAEMIADRSRGGAGVDLVVLVGAGMEHAARALAGSGWPSDRLHHFQSADGTNAARIARLLGRRDLALVKGSRRVKLERVVAALKDGSSGEDDEPTMAAGEPVGAAAGAVGVVGGRLNP
jgi:UDP-N-acetylmuramoyl-tripeptide--D-alanyl-D-alanine ligase